MVRSLLLLYGVVFCLIALSVDRISTQTVGADVLTAGVESTTDILLKLVQKFEIFQTQLVTIDTQLKQLQKIVEQRLTSDDSKYSVQDITDAIRSQKFQLAEEKLKELVDKSKVSNIVHDVYAGSSVNANIILNFAKTLKDGDFNFLFLSALRDEVQNSRDRDPLNLIALAEALGQEVTRQKVKELKDKAQIVLNKAIEDVKVDYTNIFKAAMLADDYKDNVEVRNLASAISGFRIDVSNEVMERLVDSVFGVVAAGRIIENISSHSSIPQVITGLTAVFHRFNFAGNLNNAATLTLAANLRKLQLRKGYASIGQNLKDDMDKVIQQLPACARNVFFNKNVCLWNKGRGQYMYAASTSISYDSERRNIFTWYPGDIKEGAVWYAEPSSGGDFFFRNREHADEYMYSVAIDFNKDMRYVFTWIPGNNTDEQSLWAIELAGDFCYLKTTFFNEYLFAPALKYDQLNNYVFTWKPGTSVRSAEFQWEIRNCGQAKTQGMTKR